MDRWVGGGGWIGWIGGCWWVDMWVVVDEWVDRMDGWSLVYEVRGLADS